MVLTMGQIAEGGGGFFLTGDLQAETQQALIGKALEFPTIGRELGY